MFSTRGMDLLEPTLEMEMVHAGKAVNRDAVVHAASGTNFGGARVESQGATVGRIM